jgi:hypothetical protein
MSSWSTTGGRLLVRRQLPEGLEGIAGLHALVARPEPEEWADLEEGQAQALVKVGIDKTTPSARPSW